ncbi:MAG: type I-G CRISPR-associated RAMP protein Csb1/Cas7g [Terriglobales bacterium]
MSEIVQFGNALLDEWTTDGSGIVAVQLRQRLLPVEGGERAVVFPPTYANVGYNVDDLPDGTRVATLDSVGSQANRMEPIFLRAPYDALVPRVEIDYGGNRPLSLLEAGHRLGDAVVRASGLRADGRAAFSAFLDGDAMPLAKLAPTSLVFGAWDSRDTQAKLPRIVQSVIRGWDVVELKRDAQYNPALDYAALQVFSEAEKEEAERSGGKDPRAQRGFVHVPATNLPGGVNVRGTIERVVTVNLIALRRLNAPGGGELLRRYVLGLALVAATAPMDGFLRQGCVLTGDPAAPAGWFAVERSGERVELEMEPGGVLAYAQLAAKVFGVGPAREVKFEAAAAGADLTAGDKGKAKKGKA